MKNKPAFTTNLLSIALATAVFGVAGAAQASAPFKTRDVAAAPATAPSARIIVRYHDGNAVASTVAGKSRLVSQAASRTGSAQLKSAAVSHKRQLGIGADLFVVAGKPSRADMLALVAQLNADPAVAYAQIDELRRPVGPGLRVTPSAAAPNDPYYAGYQWHLKNPAEAGNAGGINVPAAWDFSRGEGVVVAVLDTGILPAHPDFEPGALLEGYDFISDAFVSRRENDNRVPGALDYGDWNPEVGECYTNSPTSDSSWHGTHVAGTVAEASDNGLGMAGVAPKATILPVRVLGRCGGYDSDINDAITWASGGSVPGIPANPNPAQIINMSLGGGGACDAASQAAINGAVSRGTLVVVAAGNSNSNAANFSPASCNNVVNVGASTVTGGRAYYSNYGALVDFAGPGGGGGSANNGYVWQAIYSGLTTPTSGAMTYGGMAGTSMASPHVAGVAALVQSALVANGQAPLAPAELEQLLKDTARPFPVSISASTPIGTGIVDPVAALEAVLADTPVPCEGDDCEPNGPVATALTNKVVLAAQSGGEKLYSFDAAAGAVLTIMTYGGSGDVAVYVKKGAEPTASSHDAFSSRAGNSETVRITAPTAGTYFIKLTGTYSGLSVVARQ